MSFDERSDAAKSSLPLGEANLRVKLVSISDSQLGEDDPEPRRRRALCEVEPGRGVADTETFVRHLCDLELGSSRSFSSMRSAFVAVVRDCDLRRTGCHIQFRSPGCRGG
jgi:hypothetical protein